MFEADWKVLDRKVLGIIRLYYRLNVVFKIAKETTKTSLIMALANMYKKLSTMNKVHLISRLFNSRMAEGVVVAEHLNESNTIITQLTSSLLI